MHKRFRGLGVWLAMLVVAYLIYSFVVTMNSSQIKMNYSDLVAGIKSEQVQEMSVIGNNVSVTLKNGQKAKVTILSTDNLQTDVGDEMNEQMSKGTLSVEVLEAKISWAVVTNILLIIIFIAVLVFGVFRRGGGAGNFTKSRAKLNIGTKKVTFKDVAGAEEEKAELAEIVEFLKNPQKFIALGARIPKGVLLVGSPGTGKTLLAKAVAGEAGVPFFSISGSDFVELYVGVGASRVRDLFEQAKKNKPCIVFIDEIDAVGRKRGAGMGGGHDEREQTLNQLLVEMDGFTENEGVIIIAATNRPDILDRALLRPGRFDRQVVVDVPDVKGREAILQVHSARKPIAQEVSLSEIAKATSGYSGADLENLMNEAAIFAARRNHTAITRRDIEDANLKVMMGSEKRSKIITDKEKKLTAFHEAGHAVLARLVDKKSHIHKVSIVPRGRAGGFTMHVPDEDKMYTSKSDMLNEIIVLLGGRVAEALTMNDISTGASSDIQRATEIARNMVTKYAMSDIIGPVSYDDGDEVFIGRDFAHSKSYSDKTAADIDYEVKRILTSQYEKTQQILTDNMETLTRIANKLLDKETIDGIEFEECFKLPEGGENNAGD